MDIAVASQVSGITAWAVDPWRWVEIWPVLRFSTSARMETAAWLCLQTGSCLDGETLNTCSWHLLPRHHRSDEPTGGRSCGIHHCYKCNKAALLFWQEQLMWFKALLMLKTHHTFNPYFSLNRCVDCCINHSEFLNESPESHRGIRELTLDISDHFIIDQLASTSSSKHLREGCSGGMWRNTGGYPEWSVKFY